MPKNHARKKALASLKDELGIKHSCAIALLDHPDPDERATLVEYLDTYVDINTYREAVDYMEQERNDPLNQLLCETCGWTVRMVCPECPGCGCYNGQCSGWRHREAMEEEAAATGEPLQEDCDCGHYGDPHHCCECGAAGAEYDYQCAC
ncbi:hypothetical protein [Streptomyces sp. NPDC059009]|uniref:hypothetical protein n=1 Tax=Streptomyces sp. NPDC059009 TaxID=3346694 RepID=UPI003698914D